MPHRQDIRHEAMPWTMASRPAQDWTGPGLARLARPGPLCVRDVPPKNRKECKKCAKFKISRTCAKSTKACHCIWAGAKFTIWSIGFSHSFGFKVSFLIRKHWQISMHYFYYSQFEIRSHTKLMIWEKPLGNEPFQSLWIWVRMMVQLLELT